MFVTDMPSDQGISTDTPVVLIGSALDAVGFETVDSSWTPSSGVLDTFGPLYLLRKSPEARALQSQSARGTSVSPAADRQRVAQARNTPSTPGDSGIDAELRRDFEALLDRPADAPELSTLLNNDPLQVMAVARSVAAEDGNPKRVLRLLVNALAARELSPSPSPVKGRPATPNVWLQALASEFYTPDIVESAEITYRELQASLQRVRRPDKAATPDGRPMPRKKDLDLTGKAVPRGRSDAAVSIASTETELRPLSERYPRFIVGLGDHHVLSGSLVNAYEAYSRAMLLDFDAWKDYEKRSYEGFLESATFMVLSAHKTERVINLYGQVPLKETDLQKRVLDQIEKRTQIYARARVELSNNAAISQALVDLLQTLIEDPSVQEILTPQDKKRFLILIGDAAVAKRQYVEAVGVYTALGDTRRLSDVGRQLSARIYYDRQGTLLINRDIELAIEAFREANDATAMLELLTRARQARAMFETAKEKPSGYQYLDQYIRALEDAVDSEGRVVRALDRGTLKQTGATTESSSDTIALDRLPGLIRTTRQRIDSALPGQDLSADKGQLLQLGEQAARAGQISLAMEAFEPLGKEGTTRLNDLGRILAAEGKHEAAFEAFKIAGKESHPELVSLAQKIVGQGLAPRGVFNAEVPIAVEAYLLTDSSDRLELLLNDMLKLRIQFTQLDSQLESTGRPAPQRNMELLQSSIDRIAEEYDLVGVAAAPVAARPPTPAPVSPAKTTPAPTPARPAPVAKVEPPKPEPVAKVEPPKPAPVPVVMPTPVPPTPAKVEPPKPEPVAKVEPPKPAPVPVVMPAPVQPMPAKVEPPKPEPVAKVEPPKPAPVPVVMPTPVPPTPAKVEQPKPEPVAKVEPPKPAPMPVVMPAPVPPTPAKVEPPKPEPVAKVEPPKPGPVPMVMPAPVQPVPAKVEPPKPAPVAKVEPPKPAPVPVVMPAPVPPTPAKVEPPKPEPVAKVEPPKPAPVPVVLPAPVPPTPTKVEPPKPAPVAKVEPPKPAPVPVVMPAPVPPTPAKVEPPKPAPVAKVEPPKPAPVPVVMPAPVSPTPAKVEPPKAAPVAKVEPPKPAPVPVVMPAPVPPTPAKVEPPKAAPVAKVEPPKPAPVPVVMPAPVPPTPAKVEPPKAAPVAKVEPPKPAPVPVVMPAPVPPTPAKVEPPKAAPVAKVEPPKVDPLVKIDPAKATPLPGSKPEPVGAAGAKSKPTAKNPKVPAEATPTPTPGPEVPQARPFFPETPSSVYRPMLEPE